MPSHWTCPHGHEWESADAVATFKLPVLCPICATAAQATSVAELHAASTAANSADDPNQTKSSLPQPAEEPADPWATRLTPTPRPPVDPWATRAGSTVVVGPAGWLKIVGYEILGELGRGGMGVVYKARQLGFDRVVALKMILSGGHTRLEDRERFRTEAEAIARLQHAHIVQVYQIGEHEERPFFSLEFCAGGSLDKRLRATPWTPPKAARLVETLARAVHVAHQHDVVHRDLKPGNVLLTEHGVPKITDFGLAKKMDDSDRTKPGTVMGTPSYMAPEQALGKTDEIGPLADVYALGAILYEALTGRPPFKAATEQETMNQVIADEPVSPRRLQPKTPRGLETICLKCLQKAPGNRYQSAEALAEDLRRFQAGETIEARRASWAERRWRSVKRRPLRALGICGAVLAIVSTAGFVLYAMKVQSDKHDQQVMDKKNETQRLQLEEMVRNLLAASADMLDNDDEELRKRLRFGPLRDEFRKGYDKMYKDPNAAFTQERGRDSLGKAARICYAAGLFEKNFADMENARQRFDRAEALYLELLAGAEATDQTDLHRRLALVYINRGEALASLADRALSDRAPDDYKSALKHLSQANTDPDVNGQLLVAEAHHWKGTYHRDRQQYEDSERDYKTALTIRQRLFDNTQHPDAKLKRALSRSHGFLGDVYRAQAKFKDAQKEYEESHLFRKQLYDADPEDPDRALQLCRSHGNFGSLHLESGETGRIPDAIDRYLEALGLAEGLVKTYPDVNEYQKDLGYNCVQLAEAYCIQGKPEQAGVYIERANKIFGKLHETNSSEASVLSNLGTIYVYQALLRMEKEPAQAGKDLQQGRDYYKKSDMAILGTNDLYRIAFSYALSAELARGAKNVQPDPDEAERCVEQAKKFLRAAAQKSYLNVGRLDHPGFRALKQRNDYKTLEAELQAAADLHLGKRHPPPAQVP